MKLPKDKNGREIQPGDTIRLTVTVQRRARPGGRRIAIESMTDREVIVPDEGGLLPPAVHWVDFAVKWSGACLVAERIGASDFQAVMSGECKSVVTGKWVGASTAVHYMNATFDGAEFEVR